MKIGQNIFASSLLAILTLTGCESIQSYDDRAMSCYDLAREIGKLEARKDRADDDSIDAMIDSAFGDKDAEYDYMASEILSDDAQDKLRYLKMRYRNQGCR